MPNKPSVQRYDPEDYRHPREPYRAGDYVLFTDYDALAKRLERAEELLRRAVYDRSRDGYHVELDGDIDAFLSPEPEKETK